MCLAVIAYGVYGLWRVVPRFDSRLIGSWKQSGLAGPPATMTFFGRGFGRRGNLAESRTFRWWTCGNVLLMHEDRGDRSANVRVMLEYAARTLLFLDSPPHVTEFTINRLDPYGAQLLKRPGLSDAGVTQSLELRR